MNGKDRTPAAALDAGEQPTTKERILTEALTLFSVHGYEGVSVRDIAGAVGIKESSLYKHYRNKQAIFDTLLEEMNERYHTMESALGIPGAAVAPVSEAKQGVEFDPVIVYSEITEEALIEMSCALFRYYLRDDYAAKFRRMLSIEQYRNNAAGSAFTDTFLNGPLHYQSLLFAGLMNGGAFREEDPDIAALHFYSPLYLLLCLYDGHPEKEEEALERVKQHVIQFRRVYGGARG
ncbi:TetR/AcrR family transcriptional regulator [Gorillibacterium timonense]|uniref:TetR/AcrR family transcriptional regulator n=1 Tax=Gorillibacterium timonense TaxID=1689269 RepID=UPI00071E21D6|nr:TetR/AcrR family transcriptional regulator [Gorillibacterium timonense]